MRQTTRQGAALFRARNGGGAQIRGVQQACAKDGVEAFRKARRHTPFDLRQALGKGGCGEAGGSDGPELLAVLRRAAALSERTRGDFDISVGAYDSWSFDPTQPRHLLTETAVGYRLVMCWWPWVTSG